MEGREGRLLVGRKVGKDCLWQGVDGGPGGLGKDWAESAGSFLQE